MPRKILVLDGHPDGDPARYCHAIADSYVRGATSVGHVVHRLRLAELDFPFLSGRSDWDAGTPSPVISAVQDELAWADHLVIIYPLWLGAMPARLKALFEQVFRPTFAFGGSTVAPSAGRLKGRSVRIIVTMGMPGFIYRTIFLSRSLNALKYGILALVGFGPLRDTVIGGVETRPDREAVLKRISELGARGR